MGTLVRGEAPHEIDRSIDPNLHSPAARAAGKRIFPGLYSDKRRDKRSGIEELARKSAPDLYKERKR